MWHMLCESGNDLEINFRDIVADHRRGKAHWEANYTFSGGRKVHNIVDAEFVLLDELIIKHQDRFDFWRWSRMALGPIGWAAGWTPMVQKKARRTAQERLDRFVSSHPQYAGSPIPRPEDWSTRNRWSTAEASRRYRPIGIGSDAQFGFDLSQN